MASLAFEVSAADVYMFLVLVFLHYFPKMAVTACVKAGLLVKLFSSYNNNNYNNNYNY